MSNHCKIILAAGVVQQAYNFCMMKTSLIVFASFLLYGTLSAQTPHSVVVTDVRFSGLNHVPQTVQAFLAARFKGKTFNDNGWIHELEESTRMACLASGYFRATAEAKIESLQQDVTHQQVAANVVVEEGEQFRLKEIRLMGAKAFPAEQIRALFPLQPGEVFNPAKIWRGIEAALTLYRTKGYIDFTATPDTQIDETSRLIEVVIDIDEGPQYRNGRLLVVGPNSHVNQRLMRDWEFEINQVFDWDSFVRNHPSLSSYSESDLDKRLSIDKDRKNHIVNLSLDLNP
jgi:outer membrane protein assembly factor BamA